MIKTYTLWSYDVWGNAEDGFDVNDRSAFTRELEITVAPTMYNQGTPQQFSAFDPSDQQIIDALIDVGYLRADSKVSDVAIDGDGDNIEIDDNADGRPICGLELND